MMPVVKERVDAAGVNGKLFSIEFDRQWVEAAKSPPCEEESF